MNQHTSSNCDERRRQLRQTAEQIFQTVAMSLFWYFEIEVELRNLEPHGHREAAPPDAVMTVSLLNRLLAGLTAAMAEASTIDYVTVAHDRGEWEEPAPAPAASSPEPPAPEVAKAVIPKPPITVKDDRYLSHEENGIYVTGKRTSKSRCTIFGLLLEAEDGRVPMATLIRHVPVWAALLAKNDEPDDGAVKRMISKMNTLDLKPFGLPYKVKTKKDRKTGVVYVFMATVSDSPTRGYERA